MLYGQRKKKEERRKAKDIILLCVFVVGGAVNKLPHDHVSPSIKLECVTLRIKD
jgi:hypothetical protein